MTFLKLFALITLIWTCILLVQQRNVPKKYANNKYSNRKPGDMGEPVIIEPRLLSPEDLTRYSLGKAKYNYNNYVSNMIGFKRKLPDIREEWCKQPKRYSESLPPTSIIIAFYDEPWSLLLRTVNSILETSPAELIHEIILVEDISEVDNPKNISSTQNPFQEYYFQEDIFQEYDMRLPKPDPLIDTGDEYLKQFFGKFEGITNTESKLLAFKSLWPKSTDTELIIPEDPEDFKNNLKIYFAGNPKIKIVSTKRREGLIRARNIGARLASGEVLTFMDAHCECTSGWLEPLLDLIENDSNTLATPTLDEIDPNTLQYKIHPSFQVGFSWNFDFFFGQIPEKESLRRNHRAEPFFSPMIIGAAFSISKNYFFKLGLFDEGLDYWGGENFELALKVWMCGGKVKVCPCSRVGHMLREKTSYKIGDHIRKNFARVATVWMGEYAQNVFRRRKIVFRDIASLKSRHVLKRKLQCKSFSWYLKNVYPELIDTKISVVVDGLITNSIEGTTVCLHVSNSKTIDLSNCKTNDNGEFWMVTKKGEVRLDDNCLAYNGKQLYMMTCNEYEDTQGWHYDPKRKFLRHVGGECLAVNMLGNILMEKCDDDNVYHKWKIT